MVAARALGMFNEISDFLASAPTLDEIIAYRFPRELDDRLQYLMAQNNSGQITRDEKQAFEEILYWANLVSVVQTKARLKKAV